MTPAPPKAPEDADRPIRVLHFVTGGFSGGATQVALALVRAALAGQRVEPMLVLRRKPRTPPERISELLAEGIPLAVVPSWPRWLAIWQLVRICRRFRPDVLVAHGFSEHLWGRYAGLIAGVPVLVHVEHNTRERYTRWRLAQARWLARRSARLVGCSEGVRARLLELGFPAGRCMAIPNGVRLEPFADADALSWGQREAGIVMCARFAKQKDHATLLRALALLRDRGLTPPLLLAGGGSRRRRRPIERLARELGLDGQVRFLGVVRNVPELLKTHQLCVLATHYEGMPLTLVEGMAAGCAVVGSAVPGVRELIEDGVTGRLVTAGDPAALAAVLAALLEQPAEAERLALNGRRRALAEHGLPLMQQRYEDLFVQLASEAAAPR